MRSGRLPSSLGSGLSTRDSVDLPACVPEISSEDAGQRIQTLLCACILIMLALP